MLYGMRKISFKNIERIVRGFANHRRIQVMYLLNEQPELSVLEIAQKLKVNFKTIADHIQRLAVAGLVMKRNEGSTVRHVLTKRGMHILKFCRTLES